MTIADEPSTFSEVWRGAVARRTDDPFLIFETPDGQTARWSYGSFDELVARFATLLESHGVEPGRAVHLALTNSPSFVAVWLAAVRLGAWIVPSDPMAAAPELANHIQRTRPVVGFASVQRRDTYLAACGDLPVVTVDEGSIEFPGLPGRPVTDGTGPAPGDRAAVMFTSGTTGVPKGVEVSQANYTFAGKTMAGAAALSPGDRYLVVLPLFHANAQYYSFAAAIWAGASVALMPTFSASGFLDQAARHEATCASLFAAPLRMILARGGPTGGLRLRHCWYAQNITDEQHQTVSDWFGVRPRQLYGMTETIPAVLTDQGPDPIAASMGHVTPGCLVDVQDAKGRSVNPGEVGEIVVGGKPGTALFSGYLDDPATTENSFRDSWFLTGDRATRSADGHHSFVGRHSDVLKVAGENVSTVELEAVLSAHPRVLEAAVVGIADDIRDEVPVAFVVPTDPGQPPTIDDLDAWCRDRLTKFKRPQRITVIDELPRTSVGKIRKFVLVDTIRQPAGEE